MKNAVRIIGKSILCLLAGTCAGTVLLMAAYLLPVNMDNRNSSYGTLDLERWYPRAAVSGGYRDDYFHSWLPDVLDDTTDRIILHTAMDDSTGNPLVLAMESYSDYLGSYSYYWHGYVSVLRPLMLLFDFTELRIVNALGHLMLLLALAFIIRREKGIRYVAMLVTSYMLLMPVALLMSLQFTWVFYISFLGILAVLKKHSHLRDTTRFALFFLILGMLTSYFDLLTYPLVTWGLPLIWWMVTEDTEQTEGYWVRRVIISGFGWIAGYAPMWIMKWILATLILGRDVFQAAIDEVFLRTGTAEGEIYSLSGRLEALYTNWKHYEYKVYFILLAIWLVWWLCRILIAGGWKRDSRRKALLLAGSSSVVWYFALANHTQIHHFYTYRNYAVAVLAFLAITLCSVSRTEKVQEVSLKKRLTACGVFLAAGLFSILLMLPVKEGVSAVNDYEKFRQIPMNDGDICEADFTPTFDEIRTFRLGTESEGGEGSVEVEVWDTGELKYRETVLLEDFSGSFQTLEVHWELDREKTYRIVLKAKDISEPVNVMVTENGAMPLIEYGELSINGQAMEGQMMSGITYWARPISRMTQLFIMLTWTGVLLTGAYALWPIKRDILII